MKNNKLTTDVFVVPIPKAQVAVIKKQVALKEEGKKTLVEIIEDTKSGIPAKSEIETKEKRAYLRQAGSKSTSKAAS